MKSTRRKITLLTKKIVELDEPKNTPKSAAYVSELSSVVVTLRKSEDELEQIDGNEDGGDFEYTLALKVKLADISSSISLLLQQLQPPYTQPQTHHQNYCHCFIRVPNAFICRSWLSHSSM